MKNKLQKINLQTIFAVLIVISLIGFVGGSFAVDDDPHAGHDHANVEKQEPVEADEHAGHDHEAEVEEVDEHAGHDHAAEAVDEHAGHDDDAVEVDEHAGHDHGVEEAEDAHSGIIHIGMSGVKEAGIVVSRVNKGSLKSNLNLPGTVLPHPDGEGLVGTLIEGRIKDLYADYGDQVEVGQALCLVESPTAGEAEAAFAVSLAEYTFIESDYKRHQKLVDEGIGSKKEELELKMQLDMVQSTVNSAENTLLALGFSKKDIENLRSGQQSGGIVTLRSPISGAVVDRDARLGMKVNPDLDLFHIVNNKRLRVKVDIPEQEIHNIVPGMKVQVSSLNGNGGALCGLIDRIAGSISAETRTVTAFVDIKNPDGKLLPGAFVTVDIELKRGNSDVFLVPVESVFSDAHGDQVIYVEVEPGGFGVREIVTGYSRGGLIEVSEGLVMGERIVTKGAFAVKSEAAKSEFSSGCSH